VTRTVPNVKVSRFYFQQFEIIVVVGGGVLVAGILLAEVLHQLMSLQFEKQRYLRQFDELPLLLLLLLFQIGEFDQISG